MNTYRTAPNACAAQVSHTPLRSFARRFLAALMCGAALVALAVGCTPAARWAILRDSSGVICSIVVQATDPTLAPLCSSVPEILDAVKGLAGADVAAPGPGPGQVITSDALYTAILAKRGGK